MKIILYFAMCFFGVLVASESAGPWAHALKKLQGEFDREATSGGSRFHSEGLNFVEFHAHGDTWTPPQLANHFLHGIFQHYVYEITGLDMNDDSSLMGYVHFIITDASYYQDRKWSVIKGGKKQNYFYMLNAANLITRTLDPARVVRGDDFVTGEIINIPLANSIRRLLEQVIQQLKNIPLFVGLGVGFHRNRIVMEKLTSVEYFSDAAVESMQKIGVLGNDQQTAFYYWMKQTLENSVKYIRQKFVANGGKLGELKEGDERFLPDFDETLLGISQHIPTFITSAEWVYSTLVPQADVDGRAALE